MPCTKPKKPEFVFEQTQEAAEENFRVLQRYDNNLEQAIQAQKNSPLGYGSEFRPTEILEYIFRRHPLWPEMKLTLSRGSDWPLDDLPSEECKNDLEEALIFGNHKGATAKPLLLCELIAQDVMHGYCLPLPLSKIGKIPGALLAPMNIMAQSTINETGKIIEKDRLTHDQSFKWASGTSINSRVDFDQLTPCRFGHCLKRIVNWAVAARYKFPQGRILATKFDFKSAYRRLHISSNIAVQSCTQLPEENQAYVML